MWSNADGPPDGIAQPTQPNLYNELRRTPETSHYALLYRSREEQLDAALSFTQIGLENDERCLYVTDGSAPAEIAEGLTALGVDVETARAEGQLEIVPSEDAYLDGEFDPDEMADSLDEFVRESRDAGYEGFRVSGETDWVHRLEIPFEEMVAYETRCEQLRPGRRFVALCQYDLGELDDSAVVDVLQTHSKIVYRHRVCTNPFHREIDEIDEGGDPKMRAEQLLETLYDLTTAQDEIRQREQRVAVLNRVLRHNLRNEMNVIQSHAELLDDTATHPSETESIETILSTTERLMRIAEDAKRVEKSVGASVSDRVPLDLERVLSRAADRARENNPNLTVTVEGDGTCWVEASDELEFALIELFETLADLADEGAKIRVSFDETVSTHARIGLRVTCTGADLPESEIQALTRGEETPLNHGSGLGLWLVNWIVELSDGTLSFTEGESGTEEIILSFLRADGDTPS